MSMQRGTIGAERLHQGFERRLHHPGREHLLAHAPEDVVDDLAATELRCQRRVIGVLLGEIDGRRRGRR